MNIPQKNEQKKEKKRNGNSYFEFNAQIPYT